MAPRAIVHFDQLPITFHIKGTKFVLKKNFKTNMDIDRGMILTPMSVKNAFTSLERFGAEDSDGKTYVPSLVKEKTIGAIPTKSKVKKSCNKKRGRKCGSKRCKTNSPSKVVYPIVEMGQVTLEIAARESTLPKPILVTPQAHQLGQTIMIGSMLVPLYPNKEVSVTSYTEVEDNIPSAQVSTGANESSLDDNKISVCKDEEFLLNENHLNDCVSVMMADTQNLEEILQEMKKKLEEKDAQIAALLVQIAKQEKQPEVPNESEHTTNSGKMATQCISPQSSGQISTQSVSPQQIRDMIAQSFREFQISQNPSVIGYQKPFPAHFENIPFPEGYIRPTFDKFDGLYGSPYEHLAHFYSACGETARNDALLIRQFVQSLKGSAFTWYTQLPPGSIQTWNELQSAFLAQFVSTKAPISIMDLANTYQWPNESANGFISRWRSLKLQCSEKLSELACVQMCTNNLLPELAIHVGSAEPQTFEALVSIASNVEIHLARQLFVSQPQSEEEIDYGTRFRVRPTQRSNERLTLRERLAKQYPFDDDDVRGIFDELMATNSITLPRPKRPEQIGWTDNPRYCPYHRFIGHAIEDCCDLKDKIEYMIDNGEIEVKRARSRASSEVSSEIASEDHSENSSHKNDGESQCSDEEIEQSNMISISLEDNDISLLLGNETTAGNLIGCSKEFEAITDSLTPASSLSSPNDWGSR